MLTESIGAPNGTNAKQFNNQSIKKINLDEYNFDTNDNRNPNDWLANAMFCLTLEDRANKMTDGKKNFITHAGPQRKFEGDDVCKAQEYS